MKNLILITFLFVSFCCRAQTTKPIDGFLGVKFKSSKAQATSILTARGGVLDKKFEKPDESAFDNIILGNRKASYILVHYVKDQFYEGVFIFTPETEGRTIEYYNALAKDITDVYGAGKDQKSFKQPYTEGDGYEVTAIKTGNATYSIIWQDGEHEISLTIETSKKGNVLIRLYYDDVKLCKVVKELQKEKNKSEF